MYLHEHRTGVEELHGVGPVLRRRLGRLGIRTIAELLTHYPRSYQDRRRLHTLAAARTSSEPSNVLVRVRSRAWIGSGYRRTLKVTVEDSTAGAALLCYGRSFLSGSLQPGRRFWVWGRFQQRHGELQASDFEIEPYEAGQEQAAYARILPIYPLTEGLSQNTTRQMMCRALEAVRADLSDELPPALRLRRQCLPKAGALEAVHFPESMEQLDQGRKTLVYEELLHYQLALGRARLTRSSVRRSRARHGCSLRRALLDRLPFTLTSDQLRVLREIETDLFRPHPTA
ncbi:MAG: hypothetical protein JXB06_08750, partial [Spirochaetales bacterium]|nr:hypothetical protein [Spirochaetales bacterium]